jgi:hypothetical protein
MRTFESCLAGIGVPVGDQPSLGAGTTSTPRRRFELEETDLNEVPRK